MTQPLPAAGATSWYAWAAQVDAQGRAVAGKAQKLVRRAESSTTATAFTLAVGELLVIDATTALVTVTVPAAVDGARAAVKRSGTSTFPVQIVFADGAPTITLNDPSETRTVEATGTVWDVTAGLNTISALGARFAARQGLAALNRMTSPRWDDFSGSTDGQQFATRNGGRALSGQLYQHDYAASSGYSAPTAADVTIKLAADGTPRLHLNAGGADYHWTTWTGEIDSAAMAFCFGPGSTKLGGVCLCVSRVTGPLAHNAVSGVFTNSVHVSIGPDIIRTTLIDGLGSNGLTSFESGDALVNGSLGLPTDYTPITVQVYRTARDRIRILVESEKGVHYDSDNASASHPPIRDTRLPVWWGSTVGIEHLRPAASLATDAEPILLGWRAGGPVKRPRSVSPPVGGGLTMGGIPGGMHSGATFAAAFATGTTYYFPMDPETAITLAGLFAEVTTAGASGAVASWAILSADANWQPKALLADLGATMAIDSTTPTTKSLTGLGIALPARRMLLGLKLSAAASMRAMPYTVPTAPNVRSTAIGASAYAAYYSASETYGAWAAAPAAWTSTNPPLSGPGYLCPAALTWSEQ